MAAKARMGLDVEVYVASYVSSMHWAQVAAEARMGLDVEEYVASFRPDLADALFQWCRGASFAEIAKLSHVFEACSPKHELLPHAQASRFCMLFLP